MTLEKIINIMIAGRAGKNERCCEVSFIVLRLVDNL
ncbi:hypothetical protein AP058_00478 [Flavobacterium sp. TAB 87]|nr:hypothetical protein AP058_00478 [Flavobacterium sp. TAB 87]